MDRALRLNAEQRDNLVAYLDGELEEDTTQYIDQVLAKSEVARHEVEALARTWELLDLLPKPNASETFTERTLTTLRVSEVRTNVTDQPWFAYVQKTVVAVVWVAVLLASAAGGYVVTTKAIPNPHDDLLTDLELIKSLDLYQEIGSMSFVNELQRLGTFNAPVDTKPAREVEAGVIAPAPGESQRAALYRAATNLTVSERDLVVHNREQWRKLPPDRQAALRELHQQIATASASTRTTLETYYTWLQTLTLGQRDDLQSAQDNAARIALVMRFKSDQDAQRDMELFDLNLDLKRMKPESRPMPLSEVDMDAIYHYLYDRLPTTAKYEVDRGTPLLVEKYVRTVSQTGEQLGGAMKFPDDELLEGIVEVLTEESRRKLLAKDAVSRKQELRWRMAWTLQGLVWKEIEKFYPTAEQLRDVFVKQSAAERQELTQLPSNQLKQQLLRKYFDTLNDSPERKRLDSIREAIQKAFPVDGFMRGGSRGGPRPGEGGGFFPPGGPRRGGPREDGPPEPGPREDRPREPESSPKN
ncbi:MAG TPA: hypothetical protein VFG20_02490 [Planctomycetaceae bacterium]|nr:hypothetical protein [Planctomycetaceae bacterium]